MDVEARSGGSVAAEPDPVLTLAAATEMQVGAASCLRSPAGQRCVLPPPGAHQGRRPVLPRRAAAVARGGDHARDAGQRLRIPFP